MPVTEITSDPASLTMNIAAEFDATPARVWEVFTDPRQLERFWGPPGWPATFSRFDFTPGGLAQYSMTGPDGQTHRARWEFLRIDAQDSFEVLDGFADENGDLLTDLPPMRMVFSFSQDGPRTRFTGVTYFESLTALEQSVAMGMVEGTRMAMAQLDTVLQDLRAYARGKGTRLEVLDDQHVRITRLLEGPRELVWRAHTEPGLIRQWLLGPDGWRMTACEVDPRIGGRYRYAWAPDEGTAGAAFGFDGETLVWEAPRRSVTTEHMTDTDYPATVNDLQLYEEDGATLLTLLIEYPDAATRDTVLATGMLEGMETSYARLERGVLPGATTGAVITSPVATHTVGQGDDAITYDVHGDLAAASADRPALFLFGAPMDATGFQALAGYFTDRPVITYDPRGAGRNPVGTADIDVETHVEDLHRVIAALGVGPVDAFGSSGGAVNVLALAAAHPGDVRTVVAHEPPTAAFLPDRDDVLAIVADMKATYATDGDGTAMAKFISFVMLEGAVPDDYLDRPAPEPAMFGMSEADDGSRTNPLFRNMPSTIAYRPDVDALRAFSEGTDAGAGAHLVIAAGVESGETMAARGARSVAAEVGIPATAFPSNHGGFTQQPGMPSDPPAFAARLRAVLQ